jgi:hypothetical protein
LDDSLKNQNHSVECKEINMTMQLMTTSTSIDAIKDSIDAIKDHRETDAKEETKITTRIMMIGPHMVGN